MKQNNPDEDEDDKSDDDENNNDSKKENQKVNKVELAEGKKKQIVKISFFFMQIRKQKYKTKR